MSKEMPDILSSALQGKKKPDFHDLSAFFGVTHSAAAARGYHFRKLVGGQQQIPLNK